MLTTPLDMQDSRSSLESQRALDWLNFFLAALLIGFGPFVAIHLAEQGWPPASVGVALTISGLAGLITQVPAGEIMTASSRGEPRSGSGPLPPLLGF